MNIKGSEEFFEQVEKIRKKQKALSYAYLLAAIGCIFKCIRCADKCGRAGIISEIPEYEKEETEETVED